MKKRKVLISALLAAAVVSTATLASCGDKEDNKKTTTSGAAPTSTTSGAAPTSTTSGAAPTSTSTDVTDKATLRLHYNGDNLDEVSESFEFDLIDQGDGKYAEIDIDQTKLKPKDSYRDFKGWYKDKALTIAASADELSYIDSDLDLYAKWEAEGKMTTFELNATTDLSAGALANDFKKDIFKVAANTNVEGGAKPTGDYATGYSQVIKGNGSMQIFVSPLENTTLSVYYCQRSTSSVSTAGLFEVGDDGKETAIDTIYCSKDGTASGAKMDNYETGKKDFTLTGGKTYLLKGTGGTCSILDMSCQYEVTPSPVESIEVISAPVVNLIEGEQYNSSTAAGKINYLNGTSEDLKADQFEVDYSALDTTEEGVYTVKIKYSPEEYIYNKLKGQTYTADIQVKVFSIKEIILGFNETVSGKSSYNGTLENRTVKTIYKAGEEFDRNYLSVTAHATLGEGDEAEEYTKLLSTSEYQVDMVGDTVSSSGEVTVQYTTNEKVKEATYNIYVVNALDVTQATYNVKVDDDYNGTIGAVSSGVYQFKTINQAMEFLRLHN